MRVWIEANLIRTRIQYSSSMGARNGCMGVNCSIEYVGQSAHWLCQQLDAASVPTLRCCLADQHATLSGVRVNENAAESFLET